MTSRFQTTNGRIAPKFCTYTLDAGFHLRKACAYDHIIEVSLSDKDYLSSMEFDLAHDNGGEAEIVSIRVYDANDALIRSPTLQEIARQYLQDDDAHWERACDYLNEHGEAIECERDAA
jgi:hypothetical protein